MSDERPVLLCFDGSEHAKRAIREGSGLLGPHPAVVLSVWEAEADANGSTNGDTELDRAGLDVARDQAREGAKLASSFILDARPRAEAGPVWQTIVRVAEELDATVIVMGARGLSGAAAVLGSVSARVARHAHRPVLVLPPDA